VPLTVVLQLQRWGRRRQQQRQGRRAASAAEAASQVAAAADCTDSGTTKGGGAPSFPPSASASAAAAAAAAAAGGVSAGWRHVGLTVSPFLLPRHAWVGKGGGFSRIMHCLSAGASEAQRRRWALLQVLKYRYI
jgi:hypothetical protein